MVRPRPRGGFGGSAGQWRRISRIIVPRCCSFRTPDASGKGARALRLGGRSAGSSAGFGRATLGRGRSAIGSRGCSPIGSRGCSPTRSRSYGASPFRSRFRLFARIIRSIPARTPQMKGAARDQALAARISTLWALSACRLGNALFLFKTMATSVAAIVVVGHGWS